MNMDIGAAAGEGGRGGDEGVGYRWRRRAGSDAGSGPSPQRHRLPLLPPLPAPLPAIGGCSSIDNTLQQKSGSTCCSLSTRYWVRYLSVTFLNQTDLSYFILVRYPTSSLFYPKYDRGRTFSQLSSHYIQGSSCFIPCILGGKHFHNLYPLKYH
jgi:hypothetical protein